MLLKTASLAGMTGPVLFGATLLVLTLAEYDFMRSLGWHPLYAVTTDWPSGLSLGPYGGWMIAAFILAGLLLILFAVGLWQLFPKSLGPALLLVSGIAVVALSSLTDPTFRSTPATLHGQIHDAAYLLLGLSLFPGLFAMARAFGRLPDWHIHAWLTWGVLVLVIPTFIIKGITFYIFLLAVLCWYQLTAARIWRQIHSK